MLSQSLCVLDTGIKPAFALLLYARFLSSLSWPWDTCVIVWQMYRPSQTPRQTLSSERVAVSIVIEAEAPFPASGRP